ncbi:patatin [Tolypothrix sp. NIES-4075]|uniref:patatin-like phospholipase family protein n=1 Tax=Tolypothrix sp. NIES-4075 TaxID=2005459 RepID=UPI000B5CD1E4|nr:patatin-like phospholipase family protein [Tolypothrix sp. NIES-4075]GAX45253.1 patatin [Tolypothrix sp. NIES-4075]
MVIKVVVLSIDGGGIRGIFPAKILAEIEKRTEKILSNSGEKIENARICKLFDLIVGTSTGGILTLGLTKPNVSGRNDPEFKAEDLVNMYTKKGGKIFQKTRGIDRIISPWLRSKFSSNARKSVLSTYLGNTLIEHALTEVLITSYETRLRKPIFFTSKPDKENKNEEFEIRCKDYMMFDVAMGTSAAPTYFKPHNFYMNNDEVTLIDGGVFANNPTAIAVLEIMDSYYKSPHYKKNKQNISLDEILIVSIGTGKHSYKYTFKELAKMGQLQWIKEPLIKIIFDSQSEFLSYQIAQIFPKPSYYRLEPKYGNNQQVPYSGRLEDDSKIVSPSMDDINEKNILNLVSVAEEFITSNTNHLDLICQKIVESLNTRVFLKRGI